MPDTAGFATDPATAAYYDRRAGEYDEWYRGEGRYSVQSRPGWEREVDKVVELVRSLPANRTLDVACGTGFLTRHLRGFVIALDQSPAMVVVCRSRLSSGSVVIGHALQVALTDHAVDRVFTGHFYGHLRPDERTAFLAESHRVGDELVVVDSARRLGVEPEQWQYRMLNDGSRHRIYKRYLSGDQLSAEIGGETLFEGTWFVAAQASW